MGACGSSPGANQNNAIDQDLKKQNEIDKERIKLLLLGAGESGKSTIFKQMKILYGKEKTAEEKQKESEAMVPVIHQNIFTSMRVLIENSIEFGGDCAISCEKERDSLMEAMNQKGRVIAINEEMAKTIQTIWKSDGMKATWERRAEFQIVDSVKNFLDRVEEIGKNDYAPTQSDILLARVRTSGIVEERYEIDGATFCIFDVGGQRNERKKWIHCFDNVTAIIFVAALSEYNNVLYEDNSTNRMVEALNLFKEITNNSIFLKTTIILFLNKRDLFEIKIKKNHIKNIEDFKDFSGKRRNYDDGVQYFTKKFLEQAPETSDVYTHVTCAMDTNNVEVVFNACKDVIMKQNLSGSGFVMD
jgi:GTPase SAR1 family protein